MEESVDLAKVAREAVKEEEKEARKKAKLDAKFGDGEEETVRFYSERKLVWIINLEGYKFSSKERELNFGHQNFQNSSTNWKFEPFIANLCSHLRRLMDIFLEIVAEVYPPMYFFKVRLLLRLWEYEFLKSLLLSIPVKYLE